MQPPRVMVYSLAFKRQVVDEVESGRFTIGSASLHYGINGAMTVRRWVRSFGKNHLLPKVVRVETVDEGDLILQLRKQVQQLQNALGQTQATSLLTAEYLELACEQLGQDVDALKKKSDGSPSVA